MARRAAEQAYATIYDADGSSPALTTGPVLAGCSVAGSTLTLTFDAARLKGNAIVVSKPPVARPMDLALENTATAGTLMFRNPFPTLSPNSPSPNLARIDRPAPP